MPSSHWLAGLSPEQHDLVKRALRENGAPRNRRQGWSLLVTPSVGIPVTLTLLYRHAQTHEVLRTIPIWRDDEPVYGVKVG